MGLEESFGEAEGAESFGWVEEFYFFMNFLEVVVVLVEVTLDVRGEVGCGFIAKVFWAIFSVEEGISFGADGAFSSEFRDLWEGFGIFGSG